MKTILTITIVILLSSCGRSDVDYSCGQGTIKVLSKQKTACARGGGYCGFDMYLYNGTFAEWYRTDEKTYDLYQVNDTLPTIVLTVTKYIYK